jgi:hypothetical protein
MSKNSRNEDDTFDVFENTSQKKPLIPNTTKVLKTKKLNFQNKFNPKNVCCAKMHYF